MPPESCLNATDKFTTWCKSDVVIFMNYDLLQNIRLSILCIMHINCCFMVLLSEVTFINDGFMRLNQIFAALAIA